MEKNIVVLVSMAITTHFQNDLSGWFALCVFYRAYGVQRTEYGDYSNKHIYSENFIAQNTRVVTTI